MSTAESQHRPVIAIDFDGTIVEHDFPKIGKLMDGAKEAINELYDKGCYILIWTCRNNHEPDHPEWTQAPISAVRQFLMDEGVKFHGINQQQPGLGFYLESRKIFANVYIDDRNLGGFPGWQYTKHAIDKYYKLGCNWADYNTDMFKISLHGEV